MGLEAFLFPDRKTPEAHDKYPDCQGCQQLRDKNRLARLRS